MNRNSSGLKALFTFRNWILDVKSTFLMHSNSLNVSPVSLCDSFDALTAFVLFKQSIGEGKRGNEFAEWHVAWLEEWHSYAECNISRMTQRNKLNWKLRPFFGANQFTSSRFFNVAGSTTMTIKKPGTRSISTASNIFCLPLLVGLHGSIDTRSQKSALETYFNFFFCKRYLHDQLHFFFFREIVT